MEAKANATSKNEGKGDDGYVPVDGSWVAELEDAKAALKDLLRRQTLLSSSTDTSAEKKKLRGEALQLYMRLCRTYSKLRQWKELSDAAQKGLDLCSTYAASPTSASRISEWKARFDSYKKKSQKEQSVDSMLDNPECRQMLDNILTGQAYPDYVCSPHVAFPDSNVLQLAALTGDMRFLEALVARGAALDVPFLREREGFKPPDIVAPSDATALLMTVAHVAMADINHQLNTGARNMYPQRALDQLDQSIECAMQLVRLGADLTRKLNLSNAPRTMVSDMLRSSGFDGKTALEIAKMTKRRALVELLEQHSRYTPEQRAEIVHCRCGSRLPWKECHGTGIGQPPFYHLHPIWGLCYRVAPLAKCPCKNTTKAHYECCWKDTSIPNYLVDADGEKLWVNAVSPLSAAGVVMQEAQRRAKEGTLPSLPPEFKGNVHKWTASEIRRSRDNFDFIVTLESPKSQLGTWDPLVYAGCLDRLDEGFFWKDTHWKLDKTELLRRTKEWNKALKKYCDDEGLVGEEWERVIAKHTANPCAPCGRMGCTAFEKEVREFRRCSRCKAIAYCGRECQKKDWPKHRPYCI